MKKYAVRNQYLRLHTKLILKLIAKGKISPRKIWNAFVCWIKYHLKITRSASFPLMISIELWNECNVNCVFCRNEKGEIFDINPLNGKSPIVKGRMSYELYCDIIDQVKDHVLVAVLYTNGEPLMYKDLIKCVQYATDHNVATIIATNGTLMTEQKARDLLNAGLDFVKIQLSGFTQETYSVQVRKGDVEKVKAGIAAFDKINREGKHNALVLVDYISYNYNKHEFPLIQAFCADKNVMLSSRR
ncbi:MAG: radical SAM protein, partial [Candidatus Omnitrophica bacterium]|nr:radical SAM protein [Candidatus Omnitrophota bacterium]